MHIRYGYRVDILCDAATPIITMLDVHPSLRAEITVPKAMAVGDVEKLVLADEEVQRFLAGQPVKKLIVVPGRIVNVVV